jgi:hypothetical protein
MVASDLESTFAIGVRAWTAVSISYRRDFALINLLGVALKHHRE